MRAAVAREDCAIFLRYHDRAGQRAIAPGSLVEIRDADS